MGEIIQIYVGQAGVQIADACWELYCLEHGISADGSLCNCPIDDTFRNFFSFKNSEKVVPRTVLIDSEPTVIDQIRNGPYGRLYNPATLITGKEDSGSNFARGYYTVGTEIVHLTMQAIRLVAESCCNLKGFLLFRSIGGGTGAGFGNLLAEKLKDEYDKVCKLEFVIFPSPSMSPLIVEPLNALLATHLAMDSIEGTFILDNEALFDICVEKLNICAPKYENLNRIIGQIVSTFTTSQRFANHSTVSFTDFQTNLVPYPRIRFPLVSYAPFIASSEMEYANLTTEQITNTCFDPCSQLVRCNPTEGKFISCVMLYRGNVSSSCINHSLSQLKTSRTVQFVDWQSTGFKVEINTEPPFTLPCGDLSNSNKVLLTLSNNTIIQEIWTNLMNKYNQLFDRGAFIHHFTQEGLETDTLREAVEDISTLIADYEYIEIGKAVDTAKDNTIMGLSLTTEGTCCFSRFYGKLDCKPEIPFTNKISVMHAICNMAVGPWLKCKRLNKKRRGNTSRSDVLSDSKISNNNSKLSNNDKPGRGSNCPSNAGRRLCNIKTVEQAVLPVNKPDRGTTNKCKRSCGKCKSDALTVMERPMRNTYKDHPKNEIMSEMASNIGTKNISRRRTKHTKRPNNGKETTNKFKRASGRLVSGDLTVTEIPMRKTEKDHPKNKINEEVASNIGTKNPSRKRKQHARRPNYRKTVKKFKCTCEQLKSDASTLTEQPMGNADEYHPKNEKNEKLASNIDTKDNDNDNMRDKEIKCRFKLQGARLAAFSKREETMGSVQQSRHMDRDIAESESDEKEIASQQLRIKLLQKPFELIPILKNSSHCRTEELKSRHVCFAINADVCSKNNKLRKRIEQCKFEMEILKEILFDESPAGTAINNVGPNMNRKEPVYCDPNRTSNVKAVNTCEDYIDNMATTTKPLTCETKKLPEKIFADRMSSLGAASDRTSAKINSTEPGCSTSNSTTQEVDNTGRMELIRAEDSDNAKSKG